VAREVEHKLVRPVLGTCSTTHRGRWYVVGGRNKGRAAEGKYCENIFQVIELASGKVLDAGPYLPETNGWGSVVALDGSLYLFGGLVNVPTGVDTSEIPHFHDGNHTRASNDAFRYDLKEKCWERIGKCPFYKWSAGAQVDEGSIHVFGGSGSTRAHFAYDPKTGVWEKIAECPLSTYVTSALIDGVLYGMSSGSDWVFMFDPASRTWKQHFSTGLKLRWTLTQLSQHVAYKDGFFLIGGLRPDNDYDRTPRIMYIDVANRQAVHVADMASGRCCGSSAVSSQGVLYIVGGFTGKHIPGGETNEQRESQMVTQYSILRLDLDTISVSGR